MALKETNLEKLKALQLTLDKIEKNFGKGEYKMKVQLLFIRKDNENDEL